VEADLAFEGAVGLELGPSVATGLVYFVVSNSMASESPAPWMAPVTQPKANSPPPLPSNWI
jgi:hypothetical protein